MKLSEFDYELPKELIAQYPVEERDKCRLMVLDRETRSISHKTFEDIVGYFKPGDLLVMNNTKVIPARLFGKRKSGGKYARPKRKSGPQSRRPPKKRRQRPNT